MKRTRISLGCTKAKRNIQPYFSALIETPPPDCGVNDQLPGTRYRANRKRQGRRTFQPVLLRSACWVNPLPVYWLSLREIASSVVVANSTKSNTNSFDNTRISFNMNTVPPTILTLTDIGVHRAERFTYEIRPRVPKYRAFTGLPGHYQTDTILRLDSRTVGRCPDRRVGHIFDRDACGEGHVVGRESDSVEWGHVTPVSLPSPGQMCSNTNVESRDHSRVGCVLVIWPLGAVARQY